ncbi:MAG: hypothetical protein MI749_05330 [Desulfovibrionales bacterium]|nr:hypothetical protein [Desulfovibrionales bacterium]
MQRMYPIHSVETLRLPPASGYYTKLKARQNICYHQAGDMSDSSDIDYSL